MSTDAPRTSAPSRLALLIGPVLLAMAASLTAGALPARSDDTSQADSLGCGSAEVTRTLTTGSAWRMCVRIDRIKGLVLEKVQFRPATGDREYSGWLPVIDSLYLAQLVVPYDAGGFAFNDITEYGFGDLHLLDQNEQTCLGDIMSVQQSTMSGSQYSERTSPGICLDEVDTGLGWDSKGSEVDGTDNDRYSQQGSALEVSSISKISWYEYQQKVTLTDQGTITVGLGATGDLATSIFSDDPAIGWPIGSEHDEATAEHAGSHWHNAVYRVDFGIGSGAQQVQQWDYAQPDPGPRGRIEGTGTIQTQAFAADDDPDPQTWWRVLNPTSLNRDGHPRSYEIANDSIQNPYDPLTRPKVSFTNDHACQEYASDNLNAGCPGLSVPDYVAAETEPLTDPVAWVSVGFHHIVRDEDQSPMPAHWQQFSLIPRDLLAQQATTPLARSCVNGGPFTIYGSCAADNLAVPRIMVGAGPIGPGTVLSSDTGIWRPARSPLGYQRVWLRDGTPIASVGGDGLPINATAEEYTVTTADLGHEISVRVDASADGVIPGSATSSALSIPPAAGPTGSPPTSGPQHRAKPRLKVTVPARGKPRLKIRVWGNLGAATGRVVVRAPGNWKRARTLHHGRVTVRVPKAQLKKAQAKRGKRLVVKYQGDARYRPLKHQFRPHRR
ncbi:hypothetical protein KM427_10850 [Nocardioides sp. LMS-CY]|uniref:copper amine oxidase n=1 Tax=Nocardioides sp. (strain LMS-CY) TaxID=2840457 RepID=UPI001C002C80|nr:hypothetical protein [Nocardioides sp. LMS-CY]QWF24138.1 hypothetical protein KM427_10850 [Nocardioides sp. LMS-CY]